MNKQMMGQSRQDPKLGSNVSGFEARGYQIPEPTIYNNE